MRRQRYLRTSSAQSLCIFCACRLTGELPSVLTPAPFATARRRLNTTRSPSQSAGVATVEAPSNDAATTGGTPQWSGFDPNSSLTLSEQRERAMLRERRAAREREAREAVEAQRRQQEEAARVVAEQRRQEREAREKVQREEQAKIAEQWRQEQVTAQAEAAKRVSAAAAAKREAEANRVQRQRASGVGNAFRSVGGENTKPAAKDDRGGPKRGEGTPPVRKTGDGPRSAFSRSADDASETPRSARGRADGRRDGQRHVRQDGPSGRPVDQQLRRQKRDDPFVQTTATRGEFGPKRVAMPAFGGGASNAQEQDVRPNESGWGAGPVERAPLKHGEEFVRRNENIAEVAELQDRRQDAQRESGGWGLSSRQSEAPEHAQSFPQKVPQQRQWPDVQSQPYDADPEPRASPQYYDREAQPTDGEFQDFGWDAQVDQQASGAASQQYGNARPQRDDDFLAALSGGGQRHVDPMRQRTPSSPPADALNAALGGSGQRQNRPSAQQQPPPRLSRDPLADWSPLAQTPDDQYQLRSRPEATRPEELRPAFPDQERTQQQQPPRLSRDSSSASRPRAQTPNNQYQFRFRPDATRSEDPRPEFSTQGQGNDWSSTPDGDAGWGQASQPSGASRQAPRHHDEWAPGQPLPQQNSHQIRRPAPDYGFGSQQENRAPQQEQNVPYRPPPRHSQGTDSIGSYQPPSPPPPPRQGGQSAYHDSGYQATLFDPQDYQQTQSRYDEDQAANWQHLRRRNSEPNPPPRTQQYEQQQYSPNQQPLLGDEWIDRQFQAHVQQRPQQQSSYPSPFDPGFTDAQSPEFDERRTGSPTPALRRCGRCGEEGHVARECKGPIRSKCNVCGQTGHWAYDCPQNSRSAAYRNSQQGRDRQPRRGLEGADTFAGRGNGSAGGDGQRMMVRRTQSEGPSPFREMRQPEEPADAFSDRGHARRRFDGDKEGAMVDGRRDRAPGRRRFDAEEEDALSDVRDRVLRRPGAESAAQEEEEGEEGEEQLEERVLRSRKFAEVDAPAKKTGRPGRRRDEDDEEDDESGAAREERNARKASRKAEKEKAQADKQAKAAERKAKQVEARSQVKLPEFVSVATLAQTLGVRYESFVSRLERLGYDDVFPGKVLNAETSGMIAMEYDFEPVFESTSPEADERDLKPRPEVEDKEFLPTRPPVVTIMGHVDHGKTTILDYLRKSSVAAGEAGGITQHIGAFSVPLASSGKTITFLDTPGHAAFLAMRQRGANVTDIVILVVAADDSVKPQTLEAIKHAKAANVPMIVAVNKIDKEEADLQRVKQDLARHGVEIEDFGGETQVVPVSGKTGVGMEELEENVVTLSEILDHRAEMDGPVEGWVLEATTKKAGRVATVLVRRGTLKVGAVIVAGKTWARVRTLKNEGGQTVREVGPGMPVEVDGWRDQPAAGDEVLQAPSEQKASDVVEFRLEKEEREKTAQDMEAINQARRLEQEKREKEKAAERAKKAGDEDYFEAAARADEEASAEEQQSGPMSVPFIINADVSGSAEAVSAYILSVSSPLIAPRILRSQVGRINESDVELAAAAQGHIISFNLPADEGMKGQAEARGVKVLENNIIYRVLDDVKAVLEEKLPPVVTQRVLGEAEVSAAFEIGVGGRKTVKIAGCKVRNGLVGRGSKARVMRGSEKVYDGTINSLKNVKKDVQEMRKGTECGMGFEGWEAFEVGDQIQTYEEVSERRRL
ncbi:hypothetical protein LTR85_010634 [Meristemomyces frigidus]|nr:hypothetical protein LTR85_010634 [Meristemomyces frigidus]